MSERLRMLPDGPKSTALWAAALAAIGAFAAVYVTLGRSDNVDSPPPAAGARVTGGSPAAVSYTHLTLPTN